MAIVSKANRASFMGTLITMHRKGSHALGGSSAGGESAFRRQGSQKIYHRRMPTAPASMKKLIMQGNNARERREEGRSPIKGMKSPEKPRADPQIVGLHVTAPENIISPRMRNQCIQ